MRTRRPDRGVGAGALALLFGAGLLSCTAAGVLTEVALTAGRKLMHSASEQNYDSSYSSELDLLMDALIKTNPLLSPPPEEGTLDPGAEPVLAEGEVTPLGTPSAEIQYSIESTEAIQLDATLYREVIVGGRPKPIPIEDGEILRDGFGRTDAGDNLKIAFTANQNCYVYVVGIDATGWLQVIFPSGVSTFTNPVEAARQYTVPGGPEWYYLDAHRGVEQFYFVASRAPRHDIEEILVSLAGRTRPPVPEPVTISEPYEIARGLAGTRTSAAATSLFDSNGTPHQLAAQTFFTEIGGSDLTITRWFHHQ